MSERDPGVIACRQAPTKIKQHVRWRWHLQRPAKPMLREITSFMISLVPP
jgi:hypothetical protein